MTFQDYLRRIPTVVFPRQLGRAAFHGDVQRARHLRQNGPIEVIRIGNGQDAVRDGQPIHCVRSALLPMQRSDVPGNHIDQYRVCDARVLQSQTGIERREGISRQAVCGEPVGNNCFSLHRAKSVSHKRETGFATQRRNIRADNFDRGIQLCIGKQCIRVLQREEHWPRREIVVMVREAVNEPEVVIFVAIGPCR